MSFELCGIVFSYDSLIAYGGLLSMAVLPIFLGARTSLWKAPDDVERMETSDAWKFPVIGSAVLFGLYLLFLWFSKEYLNYLFTAYFMLVGAFTVTATFSPYLPLRGDVKLLKWEVSWATVAAFLLSLPICAWYLLTKHWLANNLLGLLFSVQGIAQMSLSFSTGCLLLWLLFFYDIFWVFATPVMVSVATNLDGPIKLLFPKNLLAALQASEDFKFALLGLGDIVLPGLFIALLLRFDAHLAKVSLADCVKARRFPPFPTPYFTTGIVAYLGGLCTTMLVMHVFQAAQPALLYLVPFCTIAPLITAFVRGEVSLLVNFAEEERKVKPEESKSEDSQKESDSQKDESKKKLE